MTKWKDTRNCNLRAAIVGAGLTQIEIAKEIGICKRALSYWLSDDMTDERRKRIYDAIERLSQDRQQNQ